MYSYLCSGIIKRPDCNHMNSSIPKTFKFLCCAFTALLIFSFPGCKPTRETAAALDRAEILMNEEPDSALHVLQEIQTGTLRSREGKARYSLLITQAREKNLIEHTYDSTINVAVDYYSKKGTDLDKAKAYHLQGRVYQDMDSLKSAVAGLLAAVKYSEKIADHRLTGQIYGYLGEAYQRQYDFDRAEKMITKSIEYFELAGDDYNKGYMINLLARNYMFKNMYAESLEKYREAREIFIELDNTNMIISIAGAMAAVYCWNLNDLDAALAELNGVYEEYNNGEIPLYHYPLMSQYKRANGDIGEAISLMEDYAASIPETSYTSLVGVYQVLARYEEEHGNHIKANEYYRKHTEVSDRWREEEKNNLIAAIEQRFEQQELRKEYEAFQRISNMRYIIIILISLVLFLLLLRIKVNRERVIEEKNRSIDELESYIDSLKDQSDELNELKSRLPVILNEKDEKEMRLKEVLNNKVMHLQKLLELSTLYGNNSELFLDKYKNELWNESKNQYFADMYDIVNGKYFGIIDELNSKYPDLNEEELNLCCLICFGLTNNQISMLFGHTNPNSIFTKRHKLRKKLGIWTSDIPLEDFIEETIEGLSKKGTAAKP